VSEAQGKPGLEDAILASESDTEAFHGRLRQAREFSRQAIESALRDDAKETAAAWKADAALREVEFGNLVQAKQAAEQALSLAPTKEIQIAAAIVMARTGQTGRAQAIVNNLSKQFPSDTLMASYWLPTVQAAIAIHQGNSAKAIDYLHASSLYELGGAAPPFSSGATLYPAYVRGQAYLANRQWHEAEVEFQKLIDHRGLIWNFPLGALAHLQLGRAYAGAEDKAKARTMFEDFLSLWQDADPDIPVLREAKVEYARLR
jgi:tetratricopeptide (TPR) repeat protein